MYKQSDAERKLIQIFKTFMEKAIIPQIKKFQGSLAQWSKFSSLLLTQNLNYLDLQSFVDTMPGWGLNSSEKLGQLGKKSQVETVDTNAFNPNKTIGGQKNRINIFTVSQSEKRDSQKQDSLRMRGGQNNNNILSNLQKLIKNLQQNQFIIDNINKQPPKQPSSATINRSSSSHYNGNGNNLSMPSNNYTAYLGHNLNSSGSIGHAPIQTYHQTGSLTSLNYQKNYH